MYSRRTHPLALFVIDSNRPLRLPSNCVTGPTYSSGISIVRYSVGSCSFPSISFVTTSGFPTVSSKPSLRIISTKIANCNSPLPCTSHASGFSVENIRIETFPMSSFSNRDFTSRAVSLSPSFPAKGDEFVPIVTERVGSSTVITGRGLGSSGSDSVSPMVISSIPEIATTSPAPAVSTSTRSKYSVTYRFAICALTISPSVLHHETLAPFVIVPCIILHNAIRPTYGDASRFVTQA